MRKVPNLDSFVSLCFPERGVANPDHATRRAAVKRLLSVQSLLPVERRLRAMFLSGVQCVASETACLSITYRTFKDPYDPFVPANYASVRTWNAIACSAGFGAITHNYEEERFRGEFGHAIQRPLVSHEETEQVLKGHIVGGYMQMTPFQDFADTDAALTFTDPETCPTQLQQQALELAEAMHHRCVDGVLL